MVKNDEPYLDVIVESYVSASTSGKHGKMHIRPVAGQSFDTSLLVECSKSLATNYPVGTRFRLRAKLTDREGGGKFVYSSWRWPVEVISKAKGE